MDRLEPMNISDVNADTLDEYIRSRHQVMQDTEPTKGGITIDLLVRLLRPVDHIVGWPHRRYIRRVLETYIRGRRGRGFGSIPGSEAYEIELKAIDVWTVLWPFVHVFAIYLPLYEIVSTRGHWTWSIGAFTVFPLYLLSLYRSIDILTTLAKLHLPAEYIPYRVGRAVIGTFLQLVDVTITFANTYMLLRFLLGRFAFGGARDLLSSFVTPFYYSLVTTTTLGYGEIFPRAWGVEVVVVLQLLTGIFLLIIIFQRVLGQRKVAEPESTHLVGGSGDPGLGFYQEAFYEAFLMRFRHDEEYVRGLFGRFVGVFKAEGGVVLDVGCGRGEFLEVMTQAGVDCYGLEINPRLISRCHEKGLSVVRSDWRSHLRGLHEGALGGVFAAQFVEHLKADELFDFFRLAYTSLRPGGSLAVETLTPCLNTMVKKFYVDFTHRVPLSPEALAFLAQETGFVDVAIDYYNTPTADERLAELPTTARGSSLELDIVEANFRKLSALIYLPHYYAITATKST